MRTELLMLICCLYGFMTAVTVFSIAAIRRGHSVYRISGSLGAVGMALNYVAMLEEGAHPAGRVMIWMLIGVAVLVLWLGLVKTPTERATRPSVDPYQTRPIVLLLGIMLLIPSLAFAGGSSDSGPSCGGSSYSSSSSDPGCGSPSPSSTSDGNMDCGGEYHAEPVEEPMCGKAKHSNLTLVIAIFMAVVLTLLVARSWKSGPPPNQPPKV